MGADSMLGVQGRNGQRFLAIESPFVQESICQCLHRGGAAPHKHERLGICIVDDNPDAGSQRWIAPERPGEAASIRQARPDQTDFWIQPQLRRRLYR
jgi:hypothetical protein